MDSYQMEEYIKWAVFELACNGGIDHRNYDGETRESKLKDYVMKFSTIDKAIEQVAGELVSSKEFVEYYTSYLSNNEEDNEEDIFELKMNFFGFVIDFIGLCSINNLHGDDRDNFQYKFFTYLNKSNL